MSFHRPSVQHGQPNRKHGSGGFLSPSNRVSWPMESCRFRLLLITLPSIYPRGSHIKGWTKRLARKEAPTGWNANSVAVQSKKAISIGRKILGATPVTVCKSVDCFEKGS